MTTVSRRAFVLGAACAGPALVEARAAPRVAAHSGAWYLHSAQPGGAFARRLRHAGLLGPYAGLADERSLPGPCVEVGPWDGAHAQLAVAEARGAARTRGGTWGVAFVPAGPAGRTRFVPGAAQEDEAPDLGPSTALQRRALFHAMLAGAGFVYDPAGAVCTFADGRTGALSSYGRVVREVLEFRREHPDLGEPWRPLAVGVQDGSTRAALEEALFGAGHPGDPEAAVLPGMAAPEVFDVVTPQAAAKRGGRYRSAWTMPPRDAAGLIDAARRWCPFERQTDAPLQVLRRASDGVWVAAVYNPRGARRADPFGSGCALDGDCALRERLTARFRLRSVRVLAAWPAGSRARARGGAVECVVGPGGLLVMEVAGDPWSPAAL